MKISALTARKLSAILAEAVDENEPGVVASIAHRGRLIWHGARGLANVDAQVAFTIDTPFRICSISKQFTCALVMREAVAGRISLDAHPRTYVPWTAGMDDHLTIRHLMQNKSGLRDQWVLAMMMGAIATERFTLDDGVEVMRRAPASMFAPGSQSLYCNGNFEILGAVLEAVNGKSFSDLAAAHIFAPLGMRDSFVGLDTGLPLVGSARGGARNTTAAAEACVGYRFHHEQWEPEVNGIHWGASAGIVSTMADLMKWVNCVRDPAAAGMPWVEAIKRALPFNDGAPATYASGINHLIAGGADGAGELNARSVLAHAGALRGWRSVYMHYVREEVSIAVFMNRTNSPQGKLTRGVAADIASVIGVAPVRGREHVDAAHGAPNADARLTRSTLPTHAAGWYVSREQGLLIELRNGELREGAAPARGAEVFTSLDWSPLYATHDPHVLATDDGQCAITLPRTREEPVMLRRYDANVFVPMQRVETSRRAQRHDEPPKLPAGRYRCAPLESELEISDAAILFRGIFGEGVRYPLNILNAEVAWFDLSRGVDESPPGRVLVFYDAAANTIELSCELARRMVFRRVAP
jgi:D-aminopeptidase